MGRRFPLHQLHDSFAAGNPLGLILRKITGDNARPVLYGAGIFGIFTRQYPQKSGFTGAVPSRQCQPFLLGNGEFRIFQHEPLPIRLSNSFSLQCNISRMRGRREAEMNFL